MGAVYVADDPLLARRVAIKTIPLPPGDEGETVRERLRREARITASLSHPNIISIYDFGEQGENAYIVMEYVVGKTLQAIMSATPKEEWWDRLIPVLIKCAGAIDYVHNKGIVHGDIKPGNIIVQDDGQ